jgi:hypothetical protein
MILKLKLIKVRILQKKDQKEHLKILNQVIDRKVRILIISFLLSNQIFQRNRYKVGQKLIIQC